MIILGGIRGAINIPFNQIEKADLSEYKSIILVCYIGLWNRHFAAKFSKSRSNVFRLDQGMGSWKGELVTDNLTPTKKLSQIVMFIHAVLLLIATGIEIFVSPMVGKVCFALILLDMLLGGLVNKSFIRWIIRSNGFSDQSLG